MKKPVWNVYIYDQNAQKIVPYNVFDHSGFVKDLKELKETKIKDFEEQLARIAMYHFWSKCEMEVVITSWPPYIDQDERYRLNKEASDYKEKYNKEEKCINVRLNTGMKIDVYNQLILNWDIFADCVRNYIK
jgi:hypothetical protein